jgi:hypothetical protein
MKALIVLVVAAAISALVLFYGPPVAELALTALGPDVAASDSLAESLFTAIIFGALLVAGIAGGWVSGVNALHPGPGPMPLAGFGAAIGLLGLAAAVFYAWLAGALVPAASPAPNAGLLALGSAVMLLQAGSEEVYFRGWLQPVLAERWGDSAAVGVTALLFALLHLIAGAEGGIAFVNLLLGGLLFGWLAVRTRGIAAPVLAHFAWNWAEDLGLGLVPNPGLGSFGAIRDFDLRGAGLWGGSEQGLNASVAMTVGLIAVLVPVLLLRSRSGTSGAATPVDPVARRAEGL